MLVGGGRAWPGLEIDHSERSSQRGRLAGGPPPTGTQSSPARQHTTRRPEHQRRHTQNSNANNANARQPERAAARSRN